MSHVYCSEGEQWVVGAEMPPCKYASEGETSCGEFEQGCPIAPEKNSDNRKKDTYDFKFDLEGKEVSTLDTEFISYDLLFSFIPLTNDVDLFESKATKSNLTEFHPPPDLLRPDLTKLQVFLI